MLQPIFSVRYWNVSRAPWRWKGKFLNWYSPQGPVNANSPWDSRAKGISSTPSLHPSLICIWPSPVIVKVHQPRALGMHQILTPCSVYWISAKSNCLVRFGNPIQSNYTVHLMILQSPSIPCTSFFLEFPHSCFGIQKNCFRKGHPSFRMIQWLIRVVLPSCVKHIWNVL